MLKFVSIFALLISNTCNSEARIATKDCNSLPSQVSWRQEFEYKHTVCGGFIFSNMKKGRCEICLQEFVIQELTKHIKRKHDISKEEYCIKYLNQSGICEREGCGNPTKFYSIVKGLNRFCTRDCINKYLSDLYLQPKHNDLFREKSKDNPIGKRTKGKTLEEIYGKEKAEAKRQKARDYCKTEKFQSMMKSDWYRKKLRDTSPFKGIPKTEEEREKLRQAAKGKYVKEKNGNWKGGISKLPELMSGSAEGFNWKRRIFAEDDRCFICRIKGDNQIHHLDSVSHMTQEHKITIENWRDYSNILFNHSNGIVLCKPHHASTKHDSFHWIMGQKLTTVDHFIYYLLWLDMPEKVDEFIQKYTNQNNNQSNTQNYGH